MRESLWGYRVLAEVSWLLKDFEGLRLAIRRIEEVMHAKRTIG